MRIGIDARLAGKHARGIGRYVYELIIHLMQREDMKEHVLVVFVTSKNKALFQHIQGIEIVEADIAWYGIREQLLFPFILYQQRLELIHFPHYNVPVLYRGPYIVTIHDLLLHRFPKSNNSTRHPLLFYVKYAFYKLVFRSTIYSARHIIAVSTFTQKELKALYPRLQTPITKIYEGVTEMRYSNVEEPKMKLPARYILSVGAAYPHKYLKEILPSIVDTLRKEKIFYVLVGREDYFYKQLRYFIIDNGFDDVVVFAGEVTDEELGVYYSNAVALLFPSRYEGFGLPALEAMQHHCPVIASSCGSLPEIIGDAGIVVSDDAFSEAINSLIRDTSKRDELIKKGIAHAKLFTWGNMAKETKILYNMFIQ